MGYKENIVNPPTLNLVWALIGVRLHGLTFLQKRTRNVYNIKRIFVAKGTDRLKLEEVVR